MKNLKLLFCFLFLFKFNTIFSQNKVLNYNPENESFDKPYLYYMEPFNITGPSIYNGNKYDSIRIYIYKTDRYKTQEIAINYKLKKEIPLTVISKTSASGVESIGIIKEIDGNFYIKKTKTGEGSSAKENLYSKMGWYAKRKYRTIIAENSEAVQDLRYTSVWIRRNETGDKFLFESISDLWFNWNYIVKLDFYSSKEISRIIRNDTSSVACISTGSTSTSQSSGNIVTTTISFTNSAVKAASNICVVTSTVVTKELVPISGTPKAWRAYDAETLESRFAITTGLGAIFVGSDKKNMNTQFINFVGVRMHFGRIFPNTERPYLNHRSKCSVGLGLMTTSLSFQGKTLEGFVGESNLKPVFFLGYNFNKHVGILTGISMFKQSPQVSTLSEKHAAVAPFLTLSLSTEIINYYKNRDGKKEIPDANK